MCEFFTSELKGHIYCHTDNYIDGAVCVRLGCEGWAVLCTVENYTNGVIVKSVVQPIMVEDLPELTSFDQKPWEGDGSDG